MSPKRILSGLLLTCLLALVTPQMSLAADAACASESQASYERAFIQAHGERFTGVVCDNTCLAAAADALASFNRAFIQAHGEQFDDTASAVASYNLALIGAQDHVLVDPTVATCGVVMG